MFYQLTTAILLSLTAQLIEPVSAGSCGDLPKGPEDICGPNDGSIIMNVGDTDLDPDFIYNIELPEIMDDDEEIYVSFLVDIPSIHSASSAARVYVQFAGEEYNVQCPEMEPFCDYATQVPAIAKCIEKEDGSGSFAPFTVFVTDPTFYDADPIVQENCCDKDNGDGTVSYSYAILCECPSATPYRRLRNQVIQNKFNGIQEYINKNQ